jgi:hypothetical protein
MKRRHPLSRVIFAACVALSLALVPTSLPGAEDELPPALRAVHTDIWKRFVLPAQGLVLDYSLEGDPSLIPDAVEATEGKPNALSWWTPVENGAFFSGLYLDTMVRRFQRTRLPEDREKAAKLAKGLLLCASVGSTPGFVARGVMADGKSHYSIGSDDQTAPWFYGLWRFVSSGTANDDERRQVVSKMQEVAAALRANRWEMPCEPIGGLAPGQSRGGWNGSDYRSVSRLLFAMRVMAELTGEKAWRQDYERALYEDLGGGTTRLDVLAEGIAGEWRQHPALAQDHIYIYVVSQAMVAELLALEPRAEIKKRYAESLRSSAGTCAGQTSADVARIGSQPFRRDWRMMNSMWRPQKTPPEAAELALEQLQAWANRGRGIEAQVIREPFCAAWITALGGEAPDTHLAEALERRIGSIPWDKVVSSAGFFGEAAWYVATTPAKSGNP